MGMGQLLMTYAPSEVGFRYNDKLMYSLSLSLPPSLLPPSLPPPSLPPSLPPSSQPSITAARSGSINC